MIQKSFSLPKLARESSLSQEEVSPGGKRVNKDIHKVKWSMAPKCLIEGH
jgi:hypothetical protein